MEAIAKLKNSPISPRKMRLVADLVRGMKVNDAINTLRYTKKHAARDVEKLLLSALANWEAKNEGASADTSNLVVKTIFVDPGKTIKRFRPAPFGRAHRIRKRSNHVTIVVDTAPEKTSKKSRKTTNA